MVALQQLMTVQCASDVNHRTVIGTQQVRMLFTGTDAQLKTAVNTR